VSRFWAWDPENQEPADARLLEAVDAEHAAELFAERDDYESAEFGYANDGGRVRVRDENGAVQTFSITAEARPTYTATLDETLEVRP